MSLCLLYRVSPCIHSRSDFTTQSKDDNCGRKNNVAEGENPEILYIYVSKSIYCPFSPLPLNPEF